jgi:hypothetical protein
MMPSPLPVAIGVFAAARAGLLIALAVLAKQVPLALAMTTVGGVVPMIFWVFATSCIVNNCGTKCHWIGWLAMLWFVAESALWATVLAMKILHPTSKLATKISTDASYA